MQHFGPIYTKHYLFNLKFKLNGAPCILPGRGGLPTPGTAGVRCQGKTLHEPGKLATHRSLLDPVLLGGAFLFSRLP